MATAVTTREPAIRTRGLTKRYGTFTAVDHLDLEVARGEIFGLLGPNGAGKTTTILMLLGLSEPAEGQARVLGLDPTRDTLEIKSRVGYLPDSVGFYGDLSGRDNLHYTGRLNGLTAAECNRRTEEALEQVGLVESRDKKVDAYSRGMRQRLGIADALIKEPEILVLDEPTIALDPHAVRETLDLIRRLGKERDVTVLLSSHLLHQVQAICDKVAIFVQGKIVGQGRVSELAENLGAAQTVLEVGATGEGVLEALRAVPGVDDVRVEGEHHVVRASRDVRSDIVRTLAGRNAALNHLRLRGTDLDDIYRRYFSEGGVPVGNSD